MKTLNRRHVETVITGIWSEILQVDEIGVDDDFFELGGTSLALITVVMKMADRFGLALDTSILLEGATIAALTKGVLTQAAPADRFARSSSSVEAVS
jgi:acyl carrier protein